MIWRNWATLARWSAIPVCLGLVAACGDGPTGDPDSELESGLAAATAGDLAQRVTVTPAMPAPGEQIFIASEVVNEGSAREPVTSRICGLDLESALELTGSLLLCAGYSMHSELEPGDTLKSFDAVVVRGEPGEYTLRVRHLIDPEVWVSVPIVVR